MRLFAMTGWPRSKMTRPPRHPTNKTGNVVLDAVVRALPAPMVAGQACDETPKALGGQGSS
jgi:hypothetical protein